MSFVDFANVLADKSKRQQLSNIIREFRPEYDLGQVIVPNSEIE
jgi:hypothetical protein